MGKAFWGRIQDSFVHVCDFVFVRGVRINRAVERYEMRDLELLKCTLGNIIVL